MHLSIVLKTAGKLETGCCHKELKKKNGSFSPFRYRQFFTIAFTLYERLLEATFNTFLFP